MENYVEQIKDIKVSYYEIALCNGTIEEELSKLNDIQLEYLKSELEVDDTIEDKNILLECIDYELTKRKTKKNQEMLADGNYPTIAQLEEKMTRLTLERLEFAETEELLKESISILNSYTLKNILYCISTEEITPKRQFIESMIKEELSLRHAKENEMIKSL